MQVVHVAGARQCHGAHRVPVDQADARELRARKSNRLTVSLVSTARCDCERLLQYVQRDAGPGDVILIGIVRHEGD